MSRPEDIPYDVWDEVGRVFFTVANNHHAWGTLEKLPAEWADDLQERYCRAILAETERCASIAAGWDEGLDFDLEPEATVASSVTAKSIAAAIRRGAA